MTGDEVRVSGAEDENQSSQLEADIEQTRERISGDLRTLGERLSPEHLKEEAKEIMTEAKNRAVETLHEAKDVATSAYREVKADAIDTVTEKVDEFRGRVRAAEHEALGFVRDNAVPLALIGAGIAWFVANRRRRDERWEGRYAPRGQGQWRYPERSSSHLLENGRDDGTTAKSGAAEYAEHAGDRARSWVKGAEQGVTRAAGRVRNFAERELGDARSLAHDARDRIDHTATRVRDTAERDFYRARDVARNTVQTHPLAIGAATLAAGVCVGLLIPETRRENALLGPARDRVMEGAHELAREARGLAEDVGHTAKETARDLKSSLGSSTG